MVYPHEGFPLADAGTRSSASCLSDSIRRECKDAFGRRVALHSAQDAVVVCSTRFRPLPAFVMLVMLGQNPPLCNPLARQLHEPPLTKLFCPRPRRLPML